MNLINLSILGFLAANFLTLLLVFYSVHRNWSKLVDQSDHLINLDRQVWNSKEALYDIKRILKKE
ncbi:hypothetical protein [Mesobacillus zeae]|uniref:Uncharacterized protein n=1 Tax=Mesobacillus zeae TaxID=1917180 RepID=A0A398B664_9BACI|nr:hypothetical protein [Mesobacillus zeae]RID85041.1 hypothetical protein D1970_10775 [Mesobacillus zeae]